MQYLRKEDEMKKNLEEQLTLVKTGMTEKGKDQSNGLFANLFKSHSNKVSDSTTISDSPEYRNPDKFRNL